MDTCPMGGDFKPVICSSNEFAPPISSGSCFSIKNEKQEKPTQYNEIATAPIKEASAGKGSKHTAERKAGVSFEPDLEVKELLGSVTTHNCPGTRTSARVIQKMKQDQIRPVTPPTSEREHKKEEKPLQKTPSQMRANKPTWTNLERNHFFDALNEFGKDFEAIGNYINSKLKRKCTTDVAYKTKDQVRQHYYQTYHKICKYIKFSDEVKKPAQELYGLINYGEMRRKLQFVTDKHFMKLRNLVYQGHIIVRCKGKNIRIKTPSCKSLRRLNQLDDSLEDIRLPSKIEVVVSPATMEAFGRVQSIAQNPRARTTVPLHKKLINFIKTFQYKWSSAEMRLAEEETKLFPLAQSFNTAEQQQNCPSTDPPIAIQDAEMCFLPKPGVIIHRPLLSITEYLSSVNICLTAYEERMGVKVRGESLSHERPTNKRQRTESGSEKRSPETKRQKPPSGAASEAVADKGEHEAAAFDASSTVKEELTTTQEFADPLQALKCESSSDELSDELNELLSDAKGIVRAEDVKEEKVLELAADASKIETALATSSGSCAPIANITAAAAQVTSTSGRAKRSSSHKMARPMLTFKPLLSEDVIRRIRRGWTISNAADITIGDLYVVLGQDSRLELEYYWTKSTQLGESSADASSSIFMQKQNGMPYNPADCNDPNLLKSLSNSAVANKLKHLLLIANLSERLRKRQCSCGHTCERIATKTRIERDLAAKTFVSNKTFTSGSGGVVGAVADNSSLFRQPIAPIRRPMFNMDPVKQLSTLTRQKLSRQVLVQRLLLPGGSNHSYDLLDVKNLQNNIADQKSQPTCSLASSLPQRMPFCRSSNTASTSSFTSHCASNSAAASDDSGASKSTATSCDSAILVTSFDGVEKSLSPVPPTTNHFSSVTSSASNMYHASHSGDALEFPRPSSLPDGAFDDYSNNSLFNGVSPMHLLRESTSNSRWLEENLNDFSLTSLLGHLDEINASRDILDPSSNLSVISESSVDYMHKFQEITALMQSQDKD